MEEKVVDTLGYPWIILCQNPSKSMDKSWIIVDNREYPWIYQEYSWILIDISMDTIHG